MPQAKSFIFLLLIFFFVFDVSSQTSNEAHQKIRNTIENRDYQSAVTQLENIKNSDVNVFSVNNYDYLLARMYEKLGDSASAMAYYQSVSANKSPLSEYALWHQSQIARTAGNLLLERIYLQKIITFSPQSLLIQAAKSRLIQSYFESKNFNEVITLLSVANSTTDTKDKTFSTTEPGQKRENLVLLGQAFQQSGRLNEAKDTFTKLITNLPNPAQPDDFALTAVKGLDELEIGTEKFGKTAPQLSDNEHLRRATIYQFNRNFELARLHFQAIIERFPTSNYVSNAQYQIGRGFAQEGNYPQAILWFERVQAQFPDDDVARDALSQTASAYNRVNQPNEAILHYQKFIDKYPNADNLERAYLNIIDILRDMGNDIEALSWTAKTQTLFKGKLPETLALFVQARIHITQNNWKNALSDLDKLLLMTDLGGIRVPGGTNKNEILFLKGLALENSNRFLEAIETYLSISDGRNEYYGWRATERLRLMSKNEKTQQFVNQKLSSLTANIELKDAESQRKAAQSVIRLTVSPDIQNKMLGILKICYGQIPVYQKLPKMKLLEFGRAVPLKEKRAVFSENYHKNIADELLFLGLYDEAAPEFQASNSKLQTDVREKSDLPETKNQPNQSQQDLAFTQAVFYKRGDLAHRSVAFIEPLWKNVPADFQIELIPREQIELLYPTPYIDALLKLSQPKNIDPRFALSIMRQESRFRPDVKSNAAARGLMQFIYTTANQIARELEKENFDQDELYFPPTAILFGSQYLSNLFKIFPNQPPAVAASYNGGEDNMTRWFARSKSDDPDRYISEIIFSQSKDYVYKVMANYRIYQMLYNQNLTKSDLFVE